MFNLRIFVMRTLRKMVTNEEEYKVRKFALTWYEKEVINEKDMAEIESLYFTGQEENEVNEEIQFAEDSEMA